jgi:hypothetical protein
MNGIHEVTGSIPVWSNLRLLALSLGASFGWQANEGCPPKRRSREGGPP